MDIASKAGRALWLLAGACGFALAWMILGITLGWGAAGAHAETQPDDDAASISSLVGSVTSTVSGTVETAADATTSAVEQVPVAAPVVQKARDAVAPAVAAVDDIARSGAVTTVTTPVTKTVTQITKALDPVVKTAETLPVAGEVVAALDVGGTLGAVTGTVDDVAATVDDAIGDTVGAVSGLLAEDPQDATNPAAPESPAAGIRAPVTTASSAAPPLAASAVATTQAITARMAYLVDTEGAWTRTAWTLSPAHPTAVAAIAVLNSAGTASAMPFDLSSPLAATVGAGSSTSGSAFAGPGAAALLAAGLLFAHRAWARTSRLDDDQSPPAPVLGTDVSPD